MFTSLYIKDFNLSDDLLFDEPCNTSPEDDPLYKLEEFFLNKDNVLDSSKIIEKLFPVSKKYDIFISHSHKDISQVSKLFCYLESRELNVFVDSMIWKNAYQLLKKIDQKFCKKDKTDNRYDYDKRNVSTSNVFLILNYALQQVIYNSELLIFLGTENSMSLHERINNQDTLMSPWIFSELAFTKLVNKKSPEYYRSKVATEDSQFLAEDESMRVVYPKVTLENDWSNQQFYEWLREIETKKGHECLDYLYQKLI